MTVQPGRPLPVAPDAYDPLDQSQTRRQLERMLQDIISEIDKAKKMQDKVSSLSRRRHQFLLMGA